jgi:hypothetical protein
VGASEDDIAESPPLTEGVFLELEVRVSPENRAHLIGRTNLPDGTIIMTSVAGKSSDFLGQDRATVQRGAFRSGPFGPAAGLEGGVYAAGATMPIPRVQDASVRAIIGDEGENLVGPLVERGDLGTTISVGKEFQIGTDADVAAERERRREAIAQAEVILHELRQLAEAGRRMEALRDPDDLQRLRRCGEEMRENQPKAELLRDRTEDLPRSLGIHLSIAAAYMNQCVSCLTDATESCDLAFDSLTNAETAIAEESS